MFEFDLPLGVQNEQKGDKRLKNIFSLIDCRFFAINTNILFAL